MMPKIENSTLAIVLIALLSIAIGLFVQQSQHANQDLPELGTTIILPQPKPLNAFEFVDHQDRPFTRHDLLGHWSILFFGFTNCPDICPTTLQTLKNVKQQMQQAGNWGTYRVIMVTVDPQRDSIEQLSNYVPYFDPQFLGVRGDLAMTEAFAREVGVLFIARETDNEGNYQVDHSASLILINPAGEWAGAMSAPHKVDDMVSDLSKLATYFEADHIARAPVSAVSHAETEKISAEQSSANAAALSIDGAWVRPAPPGAASMAAYFKLRNNSGSDISIIAAESPQFRSAMIHDTVINDGVASMQHRAEVVVPANGEIELAPMATHMMLMKPRQHYPLGSQIEISLTLAGGAKLKQSIPVRNQPEPTP